MPQHRPSIPCTFVFLAITVISLSGLQDVSAIEPPYCPFQILGGTTLGEAATVDEGEPLTLYVHGYPDEPWQEDLASYPESMVATHESGERSVSVSRINAFPLNNQDALAVYRADEALLDVGRWTLSVDGEPFGQLDAYPRNEDRLVLPASVAQAFVQDSEFARDYLDRNQRARSTLQVLVPVPEEWTTWHPDLHDGALMAVMLGVDTPPSASAEYSANTGFTLTSSGHIEVFSPELSCWPGRNADWIEGETLHGFVWPVGADPEEVSLRFEIELADLQHDFDEIYGDDFADAGAGGDDTGNREDDASDGNSRPTGRSGGCGVSGGSTPQHVLLSVFLLLGVVRVGRSRSASRYKAP